MKINEQLLRAQNLLMFSVILPFVYGCNGGGGGSGTPSLGNVFTEPENLTAPLASLASVAQTSPDTLAQIHNPEPATMLLLGGGILAMRYMKNRKS